MTQINSAEEALKRFSTPAAAEKYQGALVGTRKHHREVACVRKAFSSLPDGSHILDFPCGTGRLSAELAEMGFDISIADSSRHMVDRAISYLRTRNVSTLSAFVSDVLSPTPPADGFDGVLCNRLFHHFFESETRIAALRQLSTLSSGPILVSYYATGCLDAMTFKVKNAIRRRNPTDRVPIAPSLFEYEIRAAGMQQKQVIHSRPGISMQTYVLLSRG
ncbi:MAG: class I SAM-dependent methyltransferase [Pseudomonadota bacterium]